MDMYLHDNSATLRFVLRGELAAGRVRELENAWTTAASILGARDLVVDLSELTQADCAGKELLFRMREAGACVIPGLPGNGCGQQGGAANSSGRVRRPVATRIRQLIRQA